MNSTIPWLSLLLSLAILASYELHLSVLSRRQPHATARSAHALLRVEWVEALSRQAGSEIVAVQALRNSLMSATITASTAALALMGTLTVTSTTVAQDMALFGMRQMSTRLALELLLLATLFASYVCSATAMRYFSHGSFIMSLPVGSEERLRRTPMAVDYVRRAGVLYSWGLRLFLFLAPIVAGLVNPLAMPVAAIVLTLVLRAFDRAPVGLAPLG
ncbi:DUF599 domain-containing protein [Aquabacterium sp. CECT 9606]|jgi:hypothetical protein|uniref:DUF599 domain-containing protein n=1 Tax=Aquabacterium sp. CECT 9606 TaxID=2845822 RepID=UPI001E317999|nr:DUF599 domain-containing protein [Aquabacterium sp. CECT 9606]CAH0351254.1 hypothetical protein AQB9606_02001 [Aquabacterium sp. CECT 9606]